MEIEPLNWLGASGKKYKQNGGNKMVKKKLYRAISSMMVTRMERYSRLRRVLPSGKRSFASNRYDRRGYLNEELPLYRRKTVWVLQYHWLLQYLRV